MERRFRASDSSLPAMLILLSVAATVCSRRFSPIAMSAFAPTIGASSGVAFAISLALRSSMSAISEDSNADCFPFPAFATFM